MRSEYNDIVILFLLNYKIVFIYHTNNGISVFSVTTAFSSRYFQSMAILANILANLPHCFEHY